MLANVKGKAIIFIVLLILALALAGGVFYLYQQEHAKNINLQAELTDVKAKRDAAEVKVEESKKTISSLEAKLQETQVTIDTLTGDLQKEKDARQQVLAQVDQLTSDMDAQKQLRTDLETKLAQVQEEYNKSQDVVKQLSDQKANLEEKVKKMEAVLKKPAAKTTSASTPAKGVELGKIVVGTDTTKKPTLPVTQAPRPDTAGSRPELQAKTPAGAGMEGKVLVVNKEYNFAVISLGSKDGVAVGNTFLVYHDNKSIGEIKVEKLHDSMAAAGFVSQDVKDKIGEGDRVVLKTK